MDILHTSNSHTGDCPPDDHYTRSTFCVTGMPGFVWLARGSAVSRWSPFTSLCNSSRLCWLYPLLANFLSVLLAGLNAAENDRPFHQLVESTVPSKAYIEMRFKLPSLPHF